MRVRNVLDKEQSKRLYDIIRESDLSLRKVQRKTGVSLGRLGALNPKIPSYKPCTKSTALKVCESLSVNPYYILENKNPKYINWRGVFKK